MSASQRSLLSASVRTTSLLGKVEAFTFSRDAARKENVLTAWKASLKRDGNCGVCERAMASLASFASQWSPFSVSQRSPLSAAQRYSTYAENTVVREIFAIKKFSSMSLTDET